MLYWLIFFFSFRHTKHKQISLKLLCVVVCLLVCALLDSGRTMLGSAGCYVCDIVAVRDVEELPVVDKLKGFSSSFFKIFHYNITGSLANNCPSINRSSSNYRKVISHLMLWLVNWSSYANPLPFFAYITFLALSLFCILSSFLSFSWVWSERSLGI